LEETGAGRRRRRILIIDDDRLLAETLRAMIADFAELDVGLDVDVDVLRDGRRALQRLAGGGHPGGEGDYDAVICDLGLPGVDGLALYERLVADGSPLARRFILVTGGAFTAAAEDAIARHALPVLAKPFSAEALAARLRPLVASP
jgi:CheY-like chemotaxis protein